MLLFNIGWMKDYRGETSYDSIERGGTDPNKLEVENFLPLRNWYYGFGQAVSVNLSRIDPSVEDGAEYVGDVTVVFVATRKERGRVVVGWYRNARVWRNSRQRPSPGHGKYFAKARTKDCTLLKVEDRTFEVPRASEDVFGMGQSPIRYTFDKHGNPQPDTEGFIPRLWKYIEGSTPHQEPATMSLNTILYGPPGTGKTFHTVAEAVRICGEPVPEERDTLMQTYQRLLAARRIEFVTFHQSMSYEDFVEGRQPMTESDDDGNASSAGFRLETVPGIFRRIAKRAETSRGRMTGGDGITVAGHRVFKMSIGESNNPEDAHLFDEAIVDGYALLGFEDIDWSDEMYASREAIIDACKAKGRADVDAKSGWVQAPFIFRNRVREGDIVIVSKGNTLFRAIGEFTGDYEYRPRPEDDYAHRRSVRWLWEDREGVPVTEIYARRFMMKSIYMLPDSESNVPALERYLNSEQADGPAEPEPFVLIIDEINRANISKVFGELITLLEPDKRLGQPNALKVRLPYSGDDFGVPSNLHILGTMNTADRSIALLDTALRRRFTFREIMPDPSLLSGAARTCELDLPRILSTINERIEYLYDREHQIGHAYFIDCTSRTDVDAVMRHKVIPLLAEYFFEDSEKIAAVLGDAASHDGPIAGGFLNRSVLKAPPGIEDGDALPRFRWEIRSEEDGFDYSRLTGA